MRVGSRPDVRLWRSQPIAAHDKNGRIIRALPKGFPDLSGILRGGRMLAVECKAPGKKRTPEQENWGRMLTEWGACYVLAYSLADVLAALPT